MEIASGVYSMRQTGRNAYPSGYSHAYLLKNGEELTLIDALGDPDGHLVLEQLKKLGQPVRNLKHIVLTHRWAGPPQEPEWCYRLLPRMGGGHHRWQAICASGLTPTDPSSTCLSPAAWPGAKSQAPALSRR
jgi:hypothetical protein